MLQFSNIARIGVSKELNHGLRRKLFLFFPMPQTGLFQEMRCEGGDVQGPLAQGRQVDMGTLDAIQEIQTEKSLSAGVIQISVCG